MHLLYLFRLHLITEEIRNIPLIPPRRKRNRLPFIAYIRTEDEPESIINFNVKQLNSFTYFETGFCSRKG